MSRGWKPGDVAMVRRPSLPVSHCDHVAMFTEAHGWTCRSLGKDCDGEPVRPLVVIDPEDDADEGSVTRLCNLLRAHHKSEGVQVGLDWLSVQAALREFANPKPPKPEEPRGWLAAVADADGARYYRAWANADYGTAAWNREGSEYVGTALVWADVPAVRVLSEGVS